MSDIFQIQLDDTAEQAASSWERFGLNGSPFPESGVGMPVLYTRHLTEQLAKLNGWVRQVVTGKAGPLALFGSLGVGKSHLLSYFESGLRSNPKTPVLRVSLTERGMGRITLADLLIRSLPRLGERDESAIAAICSQPRERVIAHVRELGADAPLREPLLRLMDTPAAERPEAIQTLERWLRHEFTTPKKRAQVGIGGTLRREGEALVCLANIFRLAHRLELARGWFVLIDQLEELWRPHVITASRRARFLTDLRLLADLALSGSPIGLLIAWNTTVGDRGDSDVQELLDRDYRALWQRFSGPNRLDLPMLSRDDIWPFAQKYLLVAGVTASAPEPRLGLYHRLERCTPSVVHTLDEQHPERNGYHPPRQVLEAWREAASSLVHSS